MAGEACHPPPRRAYPPARGGRARGMWETWITQDRLGLVTTASEIALLFPGQGSQTPDMRDHVDRELPWLLERCVELVGEDPFERVEESTRFAQPAIFCASAAGWAALDVEPAMAAGHSLGEFGALAAAGVLTLEDALRLVVVRGRLMA